MDRIDGPDRYAASAAMSREMGSSATVFLVSGQTYPDALAAAPVAAAEDAHMLLTPSHDIPPSIENEIRRLSPTKIVLVGGEPTISSAVQQEAAALAPGARIERIAGANRVETSMRLLDRLRLSVPAADVWVASGRNFPDALAAGAVAAREGHGLVLTTGADAYFQQQLSARLVGTARFLIVGSSASVGNDVESALRQTGRTVERIAGSDRYATAVAVNQAFTTTAPVGRMLLASGANFPDALGGAILSGTTGSPLYLTNPPCASTDAVAVDANRVGARDVVALGGPPSVSSAAAQLRNCDSLAAASAIDVAVDANRAEQDPPLPGLARHACLDAMAQGWANQMAARQLSGGVHNPSLTVQARACGMRSWAENVGRTWGGERPDPDRMMAAWLASPAHAANIQRASMEHIGVGVARSSDGYWYYVLTFGTD
ncbi:cell wall-binding repeat-containing protein [Agrococcus baldri]|uniref:cell wall-binding repeat-containing protein n=1 Tax=Agrococcus baldri TaxID=153730 RepID=UPI000B89FCCC|nr:cell wall-binding repeat-containing protein [Agrococcus baldri]